MREPGAIPGRKAPQPKRNLRFYLATAKYQLSLFLRPYLLRLRGVRIHPTAVLQNVDFLGPGIVDAHCRLIGSPRIQVGRNVHFGPHVHCQGDITIDDDVWVGPRVTMWGRDHGIEPGTPIHDQPHRTEPIHVQSGVEIGPGAILLRGVTLGRGARIRAGSLCNRSVDPDTCVAGSPAKPLEATDDSSL